jgi:TolB-like protein/DNA-binding winged helix-turn-helix (wHTH) protein
MSADFRLGDCIVRPQRRIIERDGESIHVKPKSMAVFECLVAAGGAPVTRKQLFDKVWPGGEVSDDTLTKCIVELRKAFGDSAHTSKVIETIPKLGFRLVLPAEPLAADNASTETLQPSTGKWSQVLRGRLLLIALVLATVALLSFSGTRAWVTEAGVTLFLKASAILNPYSIDQNPGIAVLPFVNLSSDSDNEYFSDGLSEEILNALANTGRVRVISRTSSFQYKGQKNGIEEIGRKLGVTHLLEGSVRKVDSRILVTAQLIDVVTGTLVWSGIYQKEISDIFALQNEITENIVAQIGIALGNGTAALPGGSPNTDTLTAPGTSNLEAYDLYLKGRQMLESTNPLLIEQAPGYFDAAIAIDKDYADAWAAKGLALYMFGRPGYGHSNIPSSVYPDAIAAYRRALEIEPGHTMATGWLGVALIANDYKWAEGMRLMEQSLDQNPNDAELLSVYGMHLAFMSKEGADEVLYRAFRLDPFGTIPTIIRASRLIEVDRLLDAAALVEIGLMKDQDGYAPNYHAALLNILIGRLDAAEENLRKARQVAHPVDLSLDALQWVIDDRLGREKLPPVAKTLERMKTERLSFFEQRERLYEWEDAKTIVVAFDLGIEQRHPEMRPILFGPKPTVMPEAEWRRMKEITGVTQFQQAQ